MKTILVINDNSPNAVHATEYALMLSQRIQANILVANTINVKDKLPLKVMAGFDHETVLEKQPLILNQDQLNVTDPDQTFYRPEINEIDFSNMDVNQMAEQINKNQIWMIIKGMPETLNSDSSKGNLNIHHVLNKILCPLLLVPENWSLKLIERLVYIADLRYCRTQIVRYLAELAKPLHASISIAHLTVEGLPNIDESYALSLFTDVICRNINYDKLYFNNIKDKDMTKTLDVIIHGMQNDMLVLINRHFHFEEILGHYITETLPSQITIPVLIFPS